MRDSIILCHIPSERSSVTLMWFIYQFFFDKTFSNVKQNFLLRWKTLFQKRIGHKCFINQPIPFEELKSCQNTFLSVISYMKTSSDAIYGRKEIIRRCPIHPSSRKMIFLFIIFLWVFYSQGDHIKKKSVIIKLAVSLLNKT